VAGFLCCARCHPYLGDVLHFPHGIEGETGIKICAKPNATYQDNIISRSTISRKANGRPVCSEDVKSRYADLKAGPRGSLRAQLCRLEGSGVQ